MNAIDGVCTFLVRVTGKKTIEYIFSVAFLAFFFTFVYSIIFIFVNIPGFLFSGTIWEGGLIFMMIGICLVTVPVALLAEYILKRYDRSHCTTCNRDLACERVGEGEGFAIYRKETYPAAAVPYKCRFCGDISYKR